MTEPIFRMPSMQLQAFWLLVLYLYREQAELAELDPLPELLKVDEYLRYFLSNDGRRYQTLKPRKQVKTAWGQVWS